MKIAIIVLISLYSLVLGADFIAPYDPYYQNPLAGYAKPTSIFYDKQGLYVKEEIYKINNQTYNKEVCFPSSKKYYLRFFKNGKIFSVQKPAHIYLLGTDKLGRDLFSRLIYGSRPSMLIGFLGLLISFPIGIVYGSIAGYFGGVVDNIMMRVAEAIMSLPSFYLLVILSALLPASLSNAQRFTLITFILSFISWASLARIMRGLIASIKNKEFIEAARSIGLSNNKIILQHLIPQVTSFILVAITLSIPGFIIGESALSFLGLGINEPDPSWGNILAQGKDLSNILVRPALIYAPSLLIFLAVFAYNTIGDKCNSQVRVVD